MSTDVQAPPAAEATEETSGRGKKLVVLLLVLALVGAAAWWFLLRGPSAPEEPVPGEVVALEPIQINLADGHYLRIGVALQLTEAAHEVDGSKALDAVIELFSGAEPAELANPEKRHEYKKHLEKELAHSYHGDVLEVYFTELVTQ
jgi:flagellar protein FliL